MEHLRPELLTDILKGVSRSFYWTMRVLPLDIRPQISLAYLLARATDTIADTGLVPVPERLDALRALRGRILGESAAPLDFGALASNQGSPAERVLLERAEEALSILPQFSYSDQQRIREVLDVITGGQALDLQRFGGASEKQIVALQTDAELDDYTFRVAGCVGEFWTRLCRAHLFPNVPVNEAELLANGVRFGKGLQLVNILRDLPRDLRDGRCYIPAERLASAGLAPADLLSPANAPRFNALYHAHLDVAEAHLVAGWSYTNSLPRLCARVRLACAWPVLIGLRTLRLCRKANILDPHQRVKVSRGEMRGLVARTVLFYPWPAAWRKLAAD
ncbi:MAG: squalene/phytoene synthase family protein [Verrucomicrobia bacterium]|nr:squalene/phytoene synthase family protein [Verrucomicrobiota bacterium]